MDRREDPTDEATAAARALQATVVDLTRTLHEGFPVWPGDPHFRMRKVSGPPGFLVHQLSFGEHTGTHVDAPVHAVPGAPPVDAIPAADLLAPLVVVDLGARAASEPDTLLTPADLARWEDRYGTIPSRALVAIATAPPDVPGESGAGGSGSAGPGSAGGPESRDHPHGPGLESAALATTLRPDAAGVAHWPGFSRAAVEFLVSERSAVGIATDAPSIDCGASDDFPAHHAVLGAGRYAVEMLTRLRCVPPREATVIVAPLKHRGGSGGPARVLALVHGPAHGTDRRAGP